MNATTLLDIRDLRVELQRRDQVYQVLNGVDVALREGETLALVGESGSGKTMLCRAILGLLPQPGAHVVSGEILFEGQDLLKLSGRAMAEMRGRKIGFIPQEPMSSLNPVLSVGNQLRETLREVRAFGRGELEARAIDLLNQVRIPSPEQRLKSYPHELSGGMCQRILAAIALGGEPTLLLADEPTTALDATIQLQFLLLLRDIQRQSGCAILFVTHDFGVVGQLCDRVIVMYAGTIVETAPVDELFSNPAHPYTKALIASVPRIAGVGDRLPSIAGQPPPLNALPPGCPFASRCPEADDACRNPPPVRSVGEDHQARCWRVA